MNTSIHLFNNTANRHAMIVAHIKGNRLLGMPPYASLNSMYAGYDPLALTINDQEGIDIRNSEGAILGVVKDETLSLTSNLSEDAVDVDSIDAMLNEVYHGRQAIPYVSRHVAYTLFTGLWEKFVKHNHIKPYDATWANGTGYFKTEALPEDHTYDSFGFIDDHGRKALVLWDSRTQSRVIVFERYKPGSKDTEPFPGICKPVNNLLAYNASYRFAKGVGSSGSVHQTPYILSIMWDVNQSASLS